MCFAKGSRSFTGHELDEEAGLDLSYAGARYLDSEIGSFLSVDPVADLYPGWSPYNYGFNNPMYYSDPTGKCPEGYNEGDIWDPGDGSGLTVCGPTIVVEAERDRSNTSSVLVLGLTSTSISIPSGIGAAAAAGSAIGLLALDLYLLSELAQGNVQLDGNAFIPLSAQLVQAKLYSSTTIDWENAPPSSPDELSDDWEEVSSLAPNRKEFVNKKTGEEISFDKGQSGKPGWAGKDHWHRKNPNRTGKKDANLDKHGNPTPRGSNKSHIKAGG